MLSLGFFTLSGTGHLHPATTLGHYLRLRGHEVTFFQIPLAKALIKSAGLAFVQLPAQEPRGDNIPIRSVSRSAELGSFARILQVHVKMVLERGPDAVRKAGIDALIVDQADLAAGTVAEFLKIPFINVAFFPPLFLSNDSVPPFHFHWQHHSGVLAKIRNRMGNILAARTYAPALSIVNERRKKWNLPVFRNIDEAVSPLALIAQIPAAFDFPRRNPPKQLYYTGPFRDGTDLREPAFPWHRLTGELIVYASLGTVQNTRLPIFRAIVRACQLPGVQLVMSLGGGRLVPDDFDTFDGNQIIVHFAPQIALLKRARAAIIHGGLNTTLECLSYGVPMIVIPIADDQPGVAARIVHYGTGLRLQSKNLSGHRLRHALLRLLSDRGYGVAAQDMSTKIGEQNGPTLAASIIEDLLGTTPSPRTRVPNIE